MTETNGSNVGAALLPIVKADHAADGAARLAKGNTGHPAESTAAALAHATAHRLQFLLEAQQIAYPCAMCLIAFSWQLDPRYPLVLIANRDELHARPTAAAGQAADAPDVYGGRDLLKGGGWLELSTRRRLAAVTNVRVGRAPESSSLSRGALVHDGVRGESGALATLDRLAPTAAQYGRFNLLLWDGVKLAFASNHPDYATQAIAPGVHAMSNGALDAPWPKSVLASRALTSWMDSGAPDDVRRAGMHALEPLFAALANRTPATDTELPHTGVGLPLERMLSPPFIRDPRYGTRCSSVVIVGNNDAVFAERRFAPDGATRGDSFAILDWR